MRYRGWIRAKARGIAPYAAIDSVARAVGRIVVWVEADGRGQHPDDQQGLEDPADGAAAEDRGPDGGEHVVGVVHVAQADASVPTPAKATVAIDTMT